MEVKAAVSKARAFLEHLYKEEPLVNVLLEEVQVSEDSRHWLVTFGFQVKTELSPFKELAGQQPPRRYKQIQVDRQTGDVESMVMREGG